MPLALILSPSRGEETEGGGRIRRVRARGLQHGGEAACREARKGFGVNLRWREGGRMRVGGTGVTPILRGRRYALPNGL